MAEVLRYQTGLPSFTEILDIISRWSEKQRFVGRDKEQAKEELGLCLNALKEKTDGMSGMVRAKVEALIEEVDRAT